MGTTYSESMLLGGGAYQRFVAIFLLVSWLVFELFTSYIFLTPCVYSLYCCVVFSDSPLVSLGSCPNQVLVENYSGGDPHPPVTSKKKTLK